MQTITINGKEIEIPEGATLRVDVGRYRNAYKTRNTFESHEAGQALILYSGINIGKGFKKRLRLQYAGLENHAVTLAIERDESYLLHRGTPPYDAATATGMYDHY